MRSLPTLRSLCLSSTSLALLLAAGCSDDAECGPGTAPADGITATEGGETLTFGGLQSLQGNDCPDPAAPSGVISVAIAGDQIGGTGRITLCVPRPDQLNEGQRSVGLALSDADIRIIDLKGTSGACAYTLDNTVAPTGTGGSTGVCDAAADPAGYALTLDAQVTVKRTCGDVMDTAVVALTGTASVAYRAE